MSLIKNSFWNLAGYAAPLLVALPAMGVMARLLGVEQFGIFTLFFAVIGYAGLFDLGIGRAVIRAVAIQRDDLPGIKLILGTATLLVFASSLVAMALIIGFRIELVNALSVSPALLVSSANALIMVGIAFPFLLLGSVWFSYLEGVSNFRALNILRTFSGVCLAVCPLIGVLIKADLVHAVYGLLAGRAISVVIAYKWGLPDAPASYLFRWKSTVAADLFRFGGWLTLSNIISPIMVYFDRFFLSMLSGAKVVAFYTAPAEAVSRLLAIPGAMAKVIFPLLSAGHESGAKETRLSYIILCAICGAISLAGIFLAKLIVTLWLGEAFAGTAVTVMQVLLVGFFFNAIAQIPYTVIQAAGHSRVTALLHLAEILPYLGVLYLLIEKYGAMGAAWAWSLRVTIDCVALILLSRRYQ